MPKFFLVALPLLIGAPAAAQQMGGMAMDHGGMDHAAMGDMAMPDMDSKSGTPSQTDMNAMPGMHFMKGALGSYAMSRESAGTSWQPEAVPQAGIMKMWDGWMVMMEGRVIGIANSQSGPRGDSMLYESSMVMAMATRQLGNDDMLGLRAMLSLDPFIGRRGYPLLLASGETGDGVTPLVDRQHPHDLLMELAATYSHAFSPGDSVFLYGGYPGDPALGPTVFMHRVSGMDDPAVPISHHWLDSTHVTFGVATLGWIHDDWKLEVSQFTGREPDQFRFDFDPARFDSTSARLSYNPDANWSLQISQGFLKSPEQLEPAVNENRVTASATYYRTFDFGSLAATLAFGNKRLSDGTRESAGLIEAEYKPSDPWTLFARGESVGNHELTPDGRVRGAGEATIGLIHDWPVFDAAHFKIGLGGLYTFDFAPSSPTAPYGDDPHGAMAFLRLVAQ
jgi:hypothetical protein